jgi:hypothetical protein
VQEALSLEIVLVTMVVSFLLALAMRCCVLTWEYTGSVPGVFSDEGKVYGSKRSGGRQESLTGTKAATVTRVT